MLITIEIPAARGNAAIKDGSLQKTVEAAMQDLQPEAAYFTVLNGNRGAVLVADLPDVSAIPQVLEPFWMNLDADIKMQPAMNAEDLQSGLEKAFGATQA
jgi:hypothetical protein